MTMNRRNFLAAGAALPWALRAMAARPAPVPASTGWVLLGTDKGAGIYRARWNATTGEFGKPELAFTTDRPDFFAMHPRLPVLYAVNSMSGDKAAVTALRVHRETAELELINQRQTHGDGPCYVSVDHTGQSLFAANYSGGSMTAYRLANDGSIAQTVGVFRYNQPTHGPVSDRQDAAHLHCTTVSPNNDFVLVCDLGDDVILVFPIAPDKASYVGGPERVNARPGSGPRHLAFHPNGKWVYCIHEIDCSIDLYDWRVTMGKMNMTLREGSIISTMRPFAATKGNTASEITISESGRFLYACTRGEDTVAVFSIDPTSGLLQQIQRLPCGGQVPRFIAFDPSHRWLVSANQSSSTLTVFAHNKETGRLIPKTKRFTADTPMFVQWL
ncbi:MAG TPA: lactonase family protein [Acidobacteriaceae bacterium]|jgi:6-phosphogluconolactonase